MRTSVATALLLTIAHNIAPCCDAFSISKTRSFLTSPQISTAFNKHSPSSPLPTDVVNRGWKGGSSTTTNQSQRPSELQMATTTSSSEGKKIDIEAVGKYALSAGAQFALLVAFLRMVDFGMSPDRGMSELPTWAITAFFYGLSLRSRIFNPLNNQRPDLGKMEGDKGTPGFRDRVMPKWTPPGVFFPILWIGINGPLRAYSSTLVYLANGHVLCDPTILCLMWHLTCGDIWNTINNTERRIGASVSGVACVWLSVVYATYRYYEVDPFAGKLLGVTALWITIATGLILDTWRLNPGTDGKLDPLYPVVGDAKTKFFFEEE